ncbi:MAG TPA: hypothetical protein VF720_10675, partial [Candidatus Eisenbacteria bacterium]
MRRRIGLLVLCAATAGASCGGDDPAPQGPGLEAPFFRGVGDLPGGEAKSEALGISDDGRVV